MRQEYKGPFLVLTSVGLVIVGLIFFLLFLKKSPEERFKEYLKDTTLVDSLVNEIIKHKDKFSGNLFLKQNEIPSSVKTLVDKIFPEMELNKVDLKYKTECSKTFITLSLDRWTFEYDPCAATRPVYNDKPVVDGFFEYYQIDQYWTAYVDNDPI